MQAITRHIFQMSLFIRFFVKLINVVPLIIVSVSLYLFLVCFTCIRRKPLGLLPCGFLLSLFQVCVLKIDYFGEEKKCFMFDISRASEQQRESNHIPDIGSGRNSGHLFILGRCYRHEFNNVMLHDMCSCVRTFLTFHSESEIFLNRLLYT